MITIKALFSQQKLEKDMDDKLQKWINSLAKKLMDTGKEMVDRAIAKPKGKKDSGLGFGNITFDLRSSMGVGLVIGKSVKETYFPFKKTDGGLEHGIALLDKLALETEEQIALIMVAGERYAKFVEEKGYDVITMSFGTFEPYFLQEVQNG